MSDFSLMNHDPLPASGQGASAGTASAPLGSQITLMLRIEGLATLALATQAYYRLGWDWRLYAALFLLPDISLAGYLFDRKTGAWAYNVVHVYNLPIILGILGFSTGIHWMLAAALVWVAHIGIDRLLGLGLKLPEGIKHTHLGRLR
jgi:hypothetical protein